MSDIITFLSSFRHKLLITYQMKLNIPSFALNPPLNSFGLFMCKFIYTNFNIFRETKIQDYLKCLGFGIC